MFETDSLNIILIVFKHIINMLKNFSDFMKVFIAMIHILLFLLKAVLEIAKLGIP
jgi:hypothetical protein